MLNVSEIEKILKQGSSLPAIVSDEHGKKYLMKFKGAGEGMKNSISEFIASSVAALIGLPVLKPVLIKLDECAVNKVKNDELYDLINWSKGINIAFEFLENAVSTDRSDKIFSVEDPLITLIYLYDCFLLNIDRNPSNNNLLIVNGKIIATDYGASYLINNLIRKDPDFHSEKIISQLRRNPFYSKNPDIGILMNRFKELDFNSLKKIIEDIPDEWFVFFDNTSGAIKDKLNSALYEKINDPDYIIRTINLIDKTELVSEDQLRLKRKENLKFFEDRFGKM